MDFILKTPRTRLRLFEQKDLEDLHRLHSDAQAMHYLVGGVRPTIEATSRDLAKYLDHQECHGFSKWVVENGETGAFMGRAGFMLIPDGLRPGQEIDLGYALLPDYWGHGYASEIALALYHYGNSELTRYQQVGLIKPGHKVSARILQNIGFKFCGNGQYFGEHFDVYRP